jgi:adenine nucleotide transporter 17
MTSTLPPLTQALTGALGGTVANSLVYPLDLACARAQTLSPKERKHLGTGLYGGLAILRARIKERGPGALYDGIESDTAATLLSKYVACRSSAVIRPTTHEYHVDFLH